jgi:hypothetical protein
MRTRGVGLTAQRDKDGQSMFEYGEHVESGGAQGHEIGVGGVGPAVASHVYELARCALTAASGDAAHPARQTSTASAGSIAGCSRQLSFAKAIGQPGRSGCLLPWRPSKLRSTVDVTVTVTVTVTSTQNCRELGGRPLCRCPRRCPHIHSGLGARRHPRLALLICAVCAQKIKEKTAAPRRGARRHHRLGPDRDTPWPSASRKTACVAA